MRQANAIKEAKRVYLIGNGGSFANAGHICNDLQAVGIKAYTLDSATLSASANDYGWDTTFERWINVVGEEGDLLVALSGSGKSQNILRAITAAKAKGMKTMAVFGAYNEHAVEVDILTLGGDDMQEAEQHQLVWGHELMRSLRDNGC